MIAKYLVFNLVFGNPPLLPINRSLSETLSTSILKLGHTYHCDKFLRHILQKKLIARSHYQSGLRQSIEELKS